MIKMNRVKEICAQFQDKRILVFGDIIVDKYIFGSVERISPEAPVPVVRVESEESRCGGAGNVAVNIDKLGAHGLLLGITGADADADALMQIKPTDNFIIKSPENKTLVKTRLISQRQQIARIDWEVPVRITPAIRQKLEAILQSFDSQNLHGIIVSDYAKGTLDRNTMTLLEETAARLRIPLFVDPKPPNYSLYKQITGITPNLKEAEAIIQKKISNDHEAAAAVKSIRRKFNATYSIVTRGAQGISAGEKGKVPFHLPAFNHEVFDVTGAGDTVAALLMLALVSGANLREAVALANAAASLVVEKIGASQVTVEEILLRMKFLLNKHNPLKK